MFNSIMLLLFGKSWYFFMEKSDMKFQIMRQEIDVARVTDRIEGLRKESDGLNKIISEGKRSDGTPITDPKELDGIKDEKKLIDNKIESNTATLEQSVILLEKLDERYTFVKKVAPVRGKIIIVVIAVALILYFL